MCTCRMCKTQKIRRIVSRTLKGRAIYTDETARRWNGRQCPDCVIAKNLEHYHATKKLQGTRTYEKQLGPKTVLNPPKLRRCGDCGVMSPNYYKCPECTSLAAQVGCLDEDMYAVDTGSTRRSGLQPGFHF